MKKVKPYDKITAALYGRKIRVLAGLKPEKVFEYFENISAIPRGSGNTEQISSYCAALAASKGLKYIKDGLGNVVIFKPASKGMESSGYLSCAYR